MNEFHFKFSIGIYALPMEVSKNYLCVFRGSLWRFFFEKKATLFFEIETFEKQKNLKMKKTRAAKR